MAARQRPVRCNSTAGCCGIYQRFIHTLHCHCFIIRSNALQMLDPLLDPELHREGEGPRQHSWQELVRRGPSLCVWTLQHYLLRKVAS